MKIELTVGDDDTIQGEIALPIAPGTTADVQRRQIDDALLDAIAEKARALGAVMDAAPSRFTRQLPGKDAEGRVRFSVRARLEGDRLVPDHPSNKRR